MSTMTVERIREAINRVDALYERLVLVVAPPGSGKSAALLGLADASGYRYMNVNLLLGRLLLEVSRADRPLQVTRLLDQLLDEGEGPVLLDNLELLFDPALQFQPLNWLRRAARNRVVVAVWNGAVDRGQLTYAEAGHPEYRREPIGDLAIVTAEPLG